MTRTWAKISKRMLFVYLTLGGLIFLFMPTRLTGHLQLIYANLFRVPLAGGRSLTLAARTSATTEAPQAQDYERLLAAYRILENKNANIEAQLDAAREKIDVLSRLRNNPEWEHMGFMQAGIITDPEQGQGELLIDRGQQDGVAKDQYVLADFSIIGTVAAVVGQTARVRLITDRASKIPVQIAGSKVRGIMAGRGDGTAGITQITTRQSVQVDNVVYALNVPGSPEVSIITAKVTACKRAKDPLVWDISVRPVCDIANLKSVVVIVPRK